MANADGRTWAVGEVVTAALMNTEVRDRVDDRVFTSGDTMTGDLTMQTAAVIVESAALGNGFIVQRGVAEFRAVMPDGNSVRLLFHDGNQVASRLDLRDGEMQLAVGDTIKIGTAEVAKIVTGTYTGDGTSSRQVSTPFVPTFGIVWRRSPRQVIHGPAFNQNGRSFYVEGEGASTDIIGEDDGNHWVTYDGSTTALIVSSVANVNSALYDFTAIG